MSSKLNSIKMVVYFIANKVYFSFFKIRQRFPFLNRHEVFRRIIMCLSSPIIIFKSRKILWHLLNKNALYVDHLEVVITTHCSLKCRHCANLIQYYEHPYHISKEEIIRNIQQFTEIPDYIGCLTVLGGEPLLHPDLAEILNYSCNRANVGFVKVVTNGTIIPRNEKLIRCLQHPKLALMISDYGKISRHKQEVMKCCRENHITLAPLPPLEWWADFGDRSCRNRTNRELKKQLSACKIRCYSLLKGKLHLCPHSSNGEDLGLFQCKPYEYMDIFSDSSLKEKKKELYRFIYFGPKKISACNYCDSGSPKGMKKVIPGEQV